MCIFPTHVCCDDLFSIYPSERFRSLLCSMKELPHSSLLLVLQLPSPGGVRTTTAMHCGFKIFKMAAKVCSQPELLRRQLLSKSWKALHSVAIPNRCPEGLLCCTCLQYNRTYTPSTRLIQRCVFCCSICLNSQTSSCIHRSSTLLQCMVYRSWVHRLFPTWQNRSISHCSIESAGCPCIHLFQ